MNLVINKLIRQWRYTYYMYKHNAATYKEVKAAQRRCNEAKQEFAEFDQAQRRKCAYRALMKLHLRKFEWETGEGDPYPGAIDYWTESMRQNAWDEEERIEREWAAKAQKITVHYKVTHDDMRKMAERFVKAYYKNAPLRDDEPPRDLGYDIYLAVSDLEDVMCCRAHAREEM